MPLAPIEQFLREHPQIDRLYAESGAARFNVTRAVFDQALYRAVGQRIDTSPAFASPREIDSFLESIHVRDLGLALACRAGNAEAWEEFRSQYSHVIDSAARALISDPARSRELAQSLYADLYGLHVAGGGRVSPLDRYHGRSPLAAWLRVVIARRAADSWRTVRPAEPVEAIDRNRAGGVAADTADPERSRFVRILSESLGGSIAALPARDRLLLSYYYVQGLTLAEIAALSANHESTVSRRIAQVRARIRDEVSHQLKVEHQLSDDQVRLCFEYATDDWGFDLAEALSQAK